MGANTITVYKENVRSIKCTVTGLVDLTDYTGTLTVKKKNEDTDIVITKEGDISDLVITFDLTSALTKVDPYEYVYFITIEKTDEEEILTKYTITEDIFKVKYSP
ncbi:unnamed protein product [marine sediment metagenome]|uniref:Uncharacterized protein n=1 Tax=marine sediment metagenome TaxID=412755 RepID=X1GFV6_9ZZZZ